MQVQSQNKIILFVLNIQAEKTGPFVLFCSLQVLKCCVYLFLPPMYLFLNKYGYILPVFRLYLKIETYCVV